MDTGHFDTLARSLADGSSRRRMFAGLAGALATLLVRPDSADETLAARRKRQPPRTHRRHDRAPLLAGRKKGKRRNKNKNKNKDRNRPVNGNQPTPPQPLDSPPSSPPPPESPPAPPPTSPPPTPPPPPPPSGPGRCDFVSGAAFGGGRRWAQTFLPPRGGTLNAAQFFLCANPPDFALYVEIRPVDDDGVPTSALLGETAAVHIPRTNFGDPPREVTATFATPVPLVLGQRYALVITSPPPTNDIFAIQANHGENRCTDGKLFFDIDANENFTTSGAGDDDLVYILFIAA
jgi:hypothetical protein